MFLTIAIILLLLWAVGFFVFPLIGAVVHILLIIALMALVWHFIKRRSTTTP